jgi:hypothetical protein
VAIAGGALVGVAAGRDTRADQAGTHDDFRGELQRARTEQAIGLAALGVGVAVAVGGAIRLGIVARRRRTGPGLDARLRPGPGVTIRF